MAIPTFESLFGCLDGAPTVGSLFGRLDGVPTVGSLFGRLDGAPTVGWMELHLKCLRGVPKFGVFCKNKVIVSSQSYRDPCTVKKNSLFLYVTPEKSE